LRWRKLEPLPRSEERSGIAPRQITRGAAGIRAFIIIAISKEFSPLAKPDIFTLR
jgi:hypothetical protein